MSYTINTNIAAMDALRNINNNSAMYNQSITRLSTGLKINSAADNPSGLIIANKFQSQIDGMTQALQNTQDATNFAKTADGALGEVSSLLNSARTLAVASANNATLSASQITANQSQLNSIVASISRIASNTTYGSKHLLDGSSGVSTALTDTTNIASVSIGSQVGTAAAPVSTTAGTLNVHVTTAATQTSVVGAVDLSGGAAAAGSFSVNGVSFNVAKSETLANIVAAVNQGSAQTGVTAKINGGKYLELDSSQYGANGTISTTDPGAGILGAAVTTAGVNAVASVTIAGGTAITFTGGTGSDNGLTLKDGQGNSIVLTQAGNSTLTTAGNIGATSVGTSTFQIGSEANQTASLGIGNFSASSLGIGSLDLSSAANATTALQAIDTAIDTVSTSRGNIGSFQTNVLAANSQSLGVAKENLSSSLSSIQDTDVAAEMTNFTKYQILNSEGMSVLAQANQAPQAVLKLLG